MAEYTKYELSRLIGARAFQIAYGAEPQVKEIKTLNPIEIALKELDEGKIVLKVKKRNN